MIDRGVQRVRLERRIPLPELLWGTRHPEIDIMAVLGDLKIALELKYPKKRFTATGVITDGEPEDFDLPSGGAPDRDACAIWHDAGRIEQLLEHGIVEAGAAITLGAARRWPHNGRGHWRWRSGIAVCHQPVDGNFSGCRRRRSGRASLCPCVRWLTVFRRTSSPGPRHRPAGCVAVPLRPSGLHRFRGVMNETPPQISPDRALSHVPRW